MSGKCGDDLTWQLIEDPRYPIYYTIEPDDYYYTLVISGTGDMYDYDKEDNPHPWPSYDDDSSLPRINDIVIEDGVTSIGDYAFYNCSSYDSSTNRYPTIEIPKSVTRIGTFACCTFCAKKINIPNSVTEKATSKKISKLKARKKYYVQIRTYMKVGKKTYYSVWSKAKSVKTN